MVLSRNAESFYILEEDRATTHLKLQIYVSKYSELSHGTIALFTGSLPATGF